MQATINYEPPRPNTALRFLKGIGLLLLFPAIAAIALYLMAQSTLEAYQQQHEDRIYTGVSVWDTDVSQLTQAEASARLATLAPSIEERAITITDAETGETWTRTLGELGVSVGLGDTVEKAFAIGRTGSSREQIEQQALVWYNGVDLGGGPQIMINEAPTDAWVLSLAARVDRPIVEPALLVDGLAVGYSAAEQGRQLDVDALREDVLAAVQGLESAEITLPVRVLEPQIADFAPVAGAIQTAVSEPIALYVDKPLDDSDLARVALSSAEISRWLVIDTADAQPNVTVDQQAVRQWVAQLAPSLARQPQRARFYFDDFTGGLVLVEPHVNGRALNIDATTEQLLAAIQSETRLVPFVVDEIVPSVHSNVTGAELGITEEITRARRVTSFAGSPPERRHNIARVSQNYYGLVIAPGEPFSFNQYLDALTEENGYVEGLIIAGGQTQKEVGGGICQVSTTIYQSAFWGGFSLGARLEHSYRVTYYENDPANPREANIGMDATVYNPLVDFTFTNNTPHHLLIENYYDGVSETMTVKFYSTNIGRSVEMKRDVWNETDQLADKCVFNPDLDDGEVKQVEWGIGGASVLVERYVYNYLGEQREYLPVASSYIPTSNIFEYGPGVNPDLVCIPYRAPAPETPTTDDPQAAP